jgi:hypothetical protein
MTRLSGFDLAEGHFPNAEKMQIQFSLTFLLFVCQTSDGNSLLTP